MKTIKETKRLVAIFLTVIFMMPTMYSCSKGNNLQDVNYSSRIDGQKIIEGINLAKKSSASIVSKNNSDITITQDIVDEYLIQLGFNEGDVSVETLNEVIAKHSENKSYDELMEEYNISDISKIALQNIKEGNTYENLDDYEGYIDLEDNEKEIIAMSNSFMKSYNDSQKSSNHTKQEATGALVGLLIGGAICGVLCAIGGAILGAIIGGGSKSNNNG
ncbi:hypothetical protein [uncultured Winogradskyella sp.]|uniref:hypothetical protein n=1 Tax=uncultured Winogradskyella sp. TaxID=395353 RepID=UPI002607ABF3|nr:hypothetical protein [uncultured Winogradskyella sp.]